jgi:anti-sigma regulatory factor (Ser/Thr protein kinase)
VLVAVGADRIARLREALGGDADAVLFADMAEIGTNPAWIIPAWQQFVSEHGSARRLVRGIGEPIWAGRSADELVECQQHEALLNLAFAGSPAWHLLCPYDTETLPQPVLDEARRSHPYVVEDGRARRSESYRGLDEIAKPCDLPLPSPPADASELRFAARSLRVLRDSVAAAARRAGLDARADDLVLAVSEIAANSVRHGGGEGVLRIWQTLDALVCEVRDAGRIDAPLAGRQQPSLAGRNGRGLWIANRLCELVQVRLHEAGTVVRLHMRLSD